MKSKYNESVFSYKRRPTREVSVGGIGIGGLNPIRIQSMTNTDTANVEATLAQIRDLQSAGCEIVRVTVPGNADCDALPLLRKRMKDEGIRMPLVADIHFTPSVAMRAVEYVDKIRINPGNYADRKKFATVEYTDKEYNLELERIHEAFSPLVIRAKELGVAMRIGTNHGSLSDRIMNRFGDTPEGMVESAIEFIRIAESHGYRDIIVSMKASNTQIMVQAYRLLVATFYELGMDYPLHLGVTEAGDGKDGRIKSSIGIGALLEDGLGDTIRVSLTEDPVLEIPVAKILADRYNRIGLRDTPPVSVSQVDKIDLKESKIGGNLSNHPREFRDPFRYSRFYSREIPLGKRNTVMLGDSNPIRVELSYPSFPVDPVSAVGNAMQSVSKAGIFPESIHFPVEMEEQLELLAKACKSGIVPIPVSVRLQGSIAVHFYDCMDSLVEIDKWVLSFPHFPNREDEESFWGGIVNFQNQGGVLEWSLRGSEIPRVAELIAKLQEWNLTKCLFSIESDGQNLIHEYRKLASILSRTDFPILLQGQFGNAEDALYLASIGMGGMLLDGIGDILRISTNGSTEKDRIRELELAYDILQGARLRLSKTEYISCPSCGRTLFDLQSTTARIKNKTSHLKGVKIAVMGCIVNGPGEMADADFGYVGAGPKKVHLYRGKEIVIKNVPEEIADEKLVELIKENGMWADPN